MGHYLGTNPVKIIRRSRNLIPFPYYSSMLENQFGVIHTVNYDGSVTMSGTATSSTYNYFAIGLHLPAGTYTLSGMKEVSPKMWIRVYDQTNKVSIVSAYYGGAGSVTFTLSEAVDDIRLYFQIKQGDTASGTAYPMLNEGETALPYEPYNQLWRVRSGALIRNPKNVLQVKDYTNTYGGVTVTVKDNKLTAVGTARSSVEIWLPLEYPLAKGTYSSILGVEKALYRTSVNSLGLSPSDRDFDNRKSFAKDSSNSINNITTTFIANYMCLYIALGNTVDCSVDLMLNEGDTAEPYFVQD